MSMPGFAAEASLPRTGEHYRFTIGRMDQAEGQSIVPQYCHCTCRLTFHFDPFIGPYYAPPLHCHCFGTRPTDVCFDTTPG